MGIYLSKPIKDKESGSGSNEQLTYGYSSMQGWRMHMEDAEISQVDIIPGVSLFAVFDGHGGPEVAKFCSDHFVPQLLKNENF